MLDPVDPNRICKKLFVSTQLILPRVFLLSLAARGHLCLAAYRGGS